MQPINQAIMGQ